MDKYAGNRKCFKLSFYLISLYLISNRFSLKEFLRKIYKLIPFKNKLYKLLRYFYKPSKAIYQHLYFSGVFKAKVGNKTFLYSNYNSEIETSIFWSGIPGDWEPHSLKIWMELSKISNVIMDIGANTGIYSLISKTVNPESKVFSFEPIPRIYHRLVDNCNINHFDIAYNNIAISDKDGKSVIYDLPIEHHYLASLNKSELLHQTKKPLEIPITTNKLSSFIEKKGLQNIDLMKIDVEGHEVEVLLGMEKYLKEYQPNILIEIKSIELAVKIQELVEDIDYVYFDINETLGLNKRSSISDRSSSWNYLICRKPTAIQLNYT